MPKSFESHAIIIQITCHNHPITCQNSRFLKTRCCIAVATFLDSTNQPTQQPIMTTAIIQHWKSRKTGAKNPDFEKHLQLQSMHQYNSNTNNSNIPTNQQLPTVMQPTMMTTVSGINKCQRFIPTNAPNHTATQIATATFAQD